MHEWRSTLGATHDAGFTSFRVWAPEHRSVDLVLEGTGTSSPDMLPLTAERCGYWSARLAVPPGTRYRYRLDGNDDATFPDPASRFQPEGVHGPSQVVDPASFAWTDGGWRAPALDRLVFYEIHVGTFTPQGTFRGAIDRLPALRELGVTAIELMPVADFPGTRNWGYDGVALFAPARCYGTPDDLRALVDAAHGEGLAVFLDVVYNHLGPDGAYANAFSPYYFTDAHESPWGRGVNLDGPHSPEVRRFFIENALHWVHEYHIDGLRLDATHALQDDSPTHFLAELTTTVRQHAGRAVTFVAEDHRNLAHMLRPVSAGGWGIDAVWADDFHHHVRVHAARDREGYYQDFSGDVADLVTTLRQGWFFTGQHSAHLGERRGTDPAGLRPEQFVVCIQNHDQIGNRADGARLNHEVDLATYRALSALLAFVPYTPLLFMGQEWAASSPFMFFTDHAPDLGRKVTEGRRQEFSAFSAFADPAKREAIPDPQSPRTFERSRLDWDERSRPPHAGVQRLYQRLLQLRPHEGGCDVRALGDAALIVTRGDLSLVARLSGGGPVAIPHAGSTWRDVVLTTEDDGIADDPAPIRVDTAAPLTVVFARPGAMLIRGLSFAP
jgi:maltooligosyltrehalose trehalohydrolase